MITILLGLCLLFTTGCDDDNPSDGDADGDSDGDADSDADGDADGDADTDGDSDGDADGDADEEVEVDADLDQDVSVDADEEPIDAGPSSERQSARPLGSTDAAQGYWEYLPPRYGTGVHPLLVFLHGVGENGNGDSELDQVLVGGPPRLIDRDEWPNDRPFIVLSPQHSGGGCPSAAEVQSFLAYAISEYDVDTDRVYLTGLSCGAIGAWSYLGAHLDSQIVAMVPIAGNGRPAWSSEGCELGRVAIWAFHGDADSVVAPVGTTEPMTSLIACPSPPRREALMTIYEGVGHDSWTRTYNLSAGHDIYSWLLGFTRP